MYICGGKDYVTETVMRGKRQVIGVVHVWSSASTTISLCREPWMPNQIHGKKPDHDKSVQEDKRQLVRWKV